MSVETLLQLIVDALAPTAVGSPKTQTVVNRNLGAFERLLALGCSHKQIADGLNLLGARGRTGAPFTGNSLSTYLARARARAGRAPAGATGGTPVAESRQDRPSAIGGQGKASASPELEQFRRRINEAGGHAGTREILFRPRPGAPT